MLAQWQLNSVAMANFGLMVHANDSPMIH